MTPMVTAAEALLFTPFTGGLLLVIVYAVAYVARRDREESEAGRVPEEELLRREDEWLDHPAYRADIARTRRQEAGRRDMERVWHDATGGGSDVA